MDLWTRKNTRVISTGASPVGGLPVEELQKVHLSASYPLAFVVFRAVDWDRRDFLFEEAFGKASSRGGMTQGPSKEPEMKRHS
jgi:hypothetical protein